MTTLSNKRLNRRQLTMRMGMGMEKAMAMAETATMRRVSSSS